MIKKYLILFLTILLTACSNIQKINVTQQDEAKLNIQLEELKTNLLHNNTAILDNYFRKSLKNNYILENLKNINFTGANIFFSPPAFEDGIGKNVVAFNFQDFTIYLDLKYELLSDGMWQIVDVEERRR